MPRVSKPLVLIVEDEEQLANVIAEHLENSGMQTQVYYRCAPAIRFLQKNFANLLLLDLNLPDSSGFAFLNELRQADIKIPTIFVTGTSAEMMKIKGLDEMGGDDYIVKPFSYPELIARIRAVLRRAETVSDLNVSKNVRVTDEAFDFLGAKVTPIRLEIEFPGNKIVKIGRKELGILAYLNDHSGVVIPRKALIHSVWGIHADVRSRSLDQYIVKVRDLFGAHGIDFSAFRTIHGVGYIYDPKNVAPGTGAATPTAAGSSASDAEDVNGSAPAVSAAAPSEAAEGEGTPPQSEADVAEETPVAAAEVVPDVDDEAPVAAAKPQPASPPAAPLAKKISAPAAKPVAKPAAKPAPKATAKPAAKAPAKPAAKSSAKPVAKKPAPTAKKAPAKKPVKAKR